MATRPLNTPARAAIRSWRFTPLYAPLVASWIRDTREAYWVAPRSAPPIDAAEVLAWQSKCRESWLLTRGTDLTPIAYGELNVLNAAEHRFWIGHLIVDHAARGAGVGRELTHRLTRRAVESFGARSVTLVVFPENPLAIECYRSAGFSLDGFEHHDYPSYGGNTVMLRMTWRA